MCGIDVPVTGRAIHRLVAATVVAGVVGAAAAPALAGRATGPYSLASGAYFGAIVNPNRADGVAGSTAEVGALEADLAAAGRSNAGLLDSDNRFYGFKQQIAPAVLSTRPDGSACSSATDVRCSLEYWDLSRGRIPMITWGVSDTLTLASGSVDAWLTSQARRLRSLGGPVFLRFYHEFDGDRRVKVVHSASDYIAAWRHVHDVFAAAGATNAMWVWCPTAFKFITRSPWPPDYYPGDAYVDWVAVDGYNWYPARPGSTNRTFTQVFKAWYDWGVTTGKPLMIAEIGTLEDPAKPNAKAAWIADTRAQLEAGFAEVQAVQWFDTKVTKNGITYDWRVNSSAASYQAYEAWGADPYFNPPPPA